MACGILLNIFASVAYFFYVNMWKLNEGKMSGGEHARFPASNQKLWHLFSHLCAKDLYHCSGREVFPLWLLHHDYSFVWFGLLQPHPTSESLKMPIPSYQPSARSVKVVLILIFIWAALMIGSTFGRYPLILRAFQEDTPAASCSPDPGPVPYAFGTILTGEGDTESEVESPYFTAARLLTYQLLHSPDTRCVDNIPLLVLVTENISQGQRTTLTKDGAVVIPVENITREWDHPKWKR
jgi:hypothetical protein